MPEVINVSPGAKFGRLTVLREGDRQIAPSRPTGSRMFWCLCDCGEVRLVRLTKLRRGDTKSCRCLQSEFARSAEQAAHLARISDLGVQRVVTHGLSKTPLYSAWLGMMARCYDPEHKGYENYGGRGIAVCPEWHVVETFVAWIEASLGPRPEGLTAGGLPEYTIDRKDVNGDYAPGNVRWADRRTQALNKRQRNKVA